MRNFRATDNYVYSLEERLGQGATGDVYKGTHKKTGQIVALKIFDPKCGFQVGREIGALRKLKHPNIVTFYSVETDTDTKKTVLVMELCERGSLLDFLKEPENLYGLEEEQYLRVFRDLVAGVKHQRDNGFSHRDIKPGNILVFVDEAGNFVYKLSDFGTAKQLSDDGMFQSLVGTEEYLHPDIFRAAFIDNRKGREFSIAADLWSLGATLFHTATGRVPFQPFQGRYDRKTMFEIITAKEHGVISGQQTRADGPIEWSKELPHTCRLSRPLKEAITQILAKILEADRDLMWSFDQFFAAADEILKKRIVHIFHASCMHYYTVYTDDTTRYPEFQEVIKQYTDVQPQDQLIMFQSNNVKDYRRGGHLYDITNLQTTISKAEPVSTYPKTSSSNPFILMNTRPEDQQPDSFSEFLEVADVPVFDDLISVHDDYRTAVRISHGIYVIMKSVSMCTLSQKLLLQNVTACHKNISQQLTHCCQDLELLVERCEDINLLSKGVNNNPTRFFTTVTDNGEIDDDGTAKFCGHTIAILMSYKKSIQESTETCIKSHCTFNSGMEESCSDSKCEQKLQRLFEQSKDLLLKFRENRNRTRLSYHEEQFVKFDKQSMTRFYTRSKEILKTCCLNKLETVHKSFLQWQSQYFEIEKIVEDTQTKIQEIRSEIQQHLQTYKESESDVMPTLQTTSSPLSSTKHRQLAQNVSASVGGIQREISESRSIAMETRDQIQSLSSLLQDMPVPVTCDTT